MQSIPLINVSVGEKKCPYIYFAEFLLDFLTMTPSSSGRVEVKYTFCDFIAIDTRDNFESFNHITSEASVFQGRHF
jgi:hypothetical protein